MAVPTKAQQIARVEEWLSQESNDDKTVGVLAKELIDGIYDMWGKDLKDPYVTPKVGMAFKLPFLTSVNFVAWIGEEFGKEWVWVVNATSDYGCLLSPKSSLWRMASPSSAKAGAPGINSDGWTVGQKVSLSQRRTHLSVLSVGSKTVLMRNESDLSLWAESNANLKKYYQKETK